ncbi:peptide chain release factor N(5)-glutamine methyltransferase [Corynebacterium frankenforstense]
MSGGDLRAAVRAAARTLGAAGIETPLVDARLIAAGLLGCGPLEVALHEEVPAGFEAAIARRAGREPLQHILGSAPFGPLELFVGPGVFIPRPETEVLADAAVRRLGAATSGGVGGGAAGPVVVDLCTGSGALALYIAHELPGAQVTAVELDEAAAGWARKNIDALGLGVELVAADVTDPGLAAAGGPLAHLAGRVDCVVANPPYVPEAGEVAAEVGADPARAVFAGADGMAVIEAMLANVSALLKPGGWFGVEHDDTTAAATRAAIDATGRFTQAKSLRDLAGRERFAEACAT